MKQQLKQNSNDLLTYSLQYFGEKEIPGKENNPLITGWHKRLLDWYNGDETSWCSSFMSAMAEDCGLEHLPKGENRALARDWHNKGIGFQISLEVAIPGDIVVLWRIKPDGWQGHVGMYIRHTEKFVWLYGGNQGNSVSIKPYSISRVLSVRRLRKVSENDRSV